MTTHSSTDKRLQKSIKGNWRRRRKCSASAQASRKGRALRLEPLELRTLLSADVFEAVLGGPSLLAGEGESSFDTPAAALQAGLLSGTQSGTDGSAETEFPEAYSLCYDYEYVIITNSALVSSFQPLLQQKQSRGLTGRIVTTETIYANYAGTESGDDADKIREFIAFIHDDWGTDWVLLGGDVEIIPQRGVYAEYGGQLHHDLPSDLYYACLEGPWDGDSDGIWGEVNDGVAGADIDLVPEIYIGRAPASNAIEATNFVNKTVLYETTAHPNGNTAVWLGEQIDANTWGAYSSREIRDEVLPDSLNLIEHYELEGPWTGEQLRDDLNSSPHFVNNLSHASATYDSKLSLSAVAALTNPFPYLIYSQGCDGGSFDTVDISIAEQHVVAEHGAFAAIMNSRDGWYIPGSDPGASHRFALSFWDAVFNEGMVHLGQANQEAKLENLWRVGLCGYARWVYMETNLLGDPETPIQATWPPQEPDNLPQANDDAIELAEGATSTVLVGGSNNLLDNDTDLDLPEDTLTVNTTPVINTSHGTLTLYPDGTFSYTHDGSENLNDSFVYEVSDSTGNIASATVTITVSGINDAPVLNVPAAQKTYVQTALGITGIDIVDADVGSGSMQVTVSATHGRLTLATIAGLSFTEGDGTSDVAMTMRGTRTDLNTALATLNYHPDAGYEGNDTILLSVNDLANTGNGGALADSNSIPVEVGVVADLIAWWTVDETSGTVAADTSPFGATHNGTLQGNSQWTTLGINGALQLDGNGDGVAIPDSTDFNLRTTTARTISGWFYLADKSVNSRAQVIFEEGGDSRGLSIYVQDGRLYVGGWNRPSDESNWSGTFLSTDQIQSGQWHHVALVLNGGSTVTNDALRGYLDGVEFASGPGSQLWAHDADSAIGQAATGVRFHSGFQSGGNGLEGLLDDMRVYNRALTTSDIAALASATPVEPQTLTVSIPDGTVAENGAAISGIVTRTGNLGSSLVVTLTSSEPSRLTVPTTITFASGQSSHSFQLTPQDNDVSDGPAQVIVTATADETASGQDALTVLDDELDDTGLVAYWAMNEGSGSTAADTSPYGRNHPGTLAGDTTWSPQGLDHSLQFDGIGDRLSVPNSSSINIAWATQRTISLWFAVDDASVSAHKQLLYEEGGSTRGINIYLDSGRLYVGGWNAPHETNWTGTFLSTDQIQSGQWHHVALVLNGGNTIQPDVLKAYLGGTEFGSGAGSQLWTHSDAIGIGDVVQTTKFHDGDAGGGHGYAGLMDEVRVYTRALGAAEIQTLANQSMAAQESLAVVITADSMSEQSGSSQATVTRSGDTSSALLVTLSSSDTSEAAVPTTITIGAGQASTTFTVTALDDTRLDGDQSVSITASATDMASGNDSILVTDDEEVLVYGVVNNVADTWTTVTLPQDYVSMVVVATPSYTESHISAVTRIRNATGSSFELRVDRTDGSTGPVPGVSVHYVVAEEGVYTAAQDGVTMEAVKYNSTVTDGRGNWVGQSRSYAQSYQSPVVLGQVQTYNDSDFSVFWSHGAAASDPASSSVLRVGKHVGEDADTTRAAESVGYLVLEAGTATAGSVTFTAGVGAATVEGMDNTPPFNYALSDLSAASVAVAGLAGMYGDQGAWAVLYGADPVNATRLQLAADEDQAADSERVHVAENVSYLVFEDSALRLQEQATRDLKTAETFAAEMRAAVTLDAVEALVWQAAALWDVDGAEQTLDRLEIQVRDLPRNELARVVENNDTNLLLVDINAAGQGWFVDSTPALHEEFSHQAIDDFWTALENGPAVERIDLLSVLMHELGHLLGQGHNHNDSQDVMSGTLQAGVRRLPPAT